MAYKGKFQPKNPKKYKGDPTNIIYRSRWELRFMQHLDEHPKVVQWSSEEFFVPYRTKIEPRKWRRYFPDFWIKKINKEGKEDIVVVEIKPKKFTVPPKTKKKVTRTYLAEVQRWDMNSSKWEYAKEYCEDRGWKFVVMTEETMGINF